jgi:hypothetical protein
MLYLLPIVQNWIKNLVVQIKTFAYGRTKNARDLLVRILLKKRNAKVMFRGKLAITSRPVHLLQVVKKLKILNNAIH